MISIPFPTFDMSEAEAHQQFQIYTALKKIYNTEIESDFLINIKDFDIFNANELNSHGAIFKISNNSRVFYLEFIQILYKTGGQRYSSGIYVEYQIWGIINLQNHFGHILIKPETFLDKIHDLINPVDLDFEEDKEFSNKFLVVTNDEVKSRMMMTKNFRDWIMQIQLNDFVIEIKENKLIIGDKKVVSLESALEFAKYLNKLAGKF